MRWRNAATAAPGIGGAVMAKLACPACWPIYAGILGSLGIGAAALEPFLVPLGGIFLAVALVSLGYRARNRRGYGPLVLGLAAALALALGELMLHSEAIAYSGVALLIGASIWNAWPSRTPESGGCEPRVTQETARSIGGDKLSRCGCGEDMIKL